MDKILLQGMRFYAYHGVFPEEQRLGQTYIVDMEVYTDLQKAGQTDDLAHTINYGEIYSLVEHTVVHQRYQLIEALAEQIASSTLQSYPAIQETMVRVVKPNPPIPGTYDSVAVEIRRTREK